MTSSALADPFTSRSDWAISRLRKSLRADPGPALRGLVAGHSEVILAQIRRFVTDNEDARDLLQDVCLQILRKGYTYAGEGSMLGWAVSVARNTCLSALRRPDRRYVVQSADSATGLGAIQTASARDTPDVVVERAELRRDLGRAIQNLAPRQRAVFVMRLIEGRSTRETASRLGCSTGTVKGTLFRAKAQLRVELAAWHQ